MATAKADREEWEGKGVQTVKPLHKVEAHLHKGTLDKMHLLSTGHVNA